MARRTKLPARTERTTGRELGYKLPVEFVPVRFTSWMGGDRDGNPNVTADITRHVLLLSRWKATDLFLKDIQVLVSELSMVEATLNCWRWLAKKVPQNRIAI